MLAYNLKRLREGKGMSQAELAKEFNVAQQTVGKWEKNITCPPLDTAKEIAAYFGVSLDYLSGNAENGGPPTAPIEIDPKVRKKIDSIIDDLVKLQPDQIDLAQHLIGGLLEFDERKTSASKKE